MKKLFTLISLTTLSYTQCYSQKTDTVKKQVISAAIDSSMILSTFEAEPQYDETGSSWNNFLKKHINYDIAIFNEAPRGIYIVKVQFTVFADGHVGDIKALTRFGYGMEKEVIKALRKSPPWKPAMQNGKAVNAIRIQTIRFAVEVL